MNSLSKEGLSDLVCQLWNHFSGYFRPNGLVKSVYKDQIKGGAIVDNSFECFLTCQRYDATFCGYKVCIDRRWKVSIQEYLLDPANFKDFLAESMISISLPVQFAL